MKTIIASLLLLLPVIAFASDKSGKEYQNEPEKYDGQKVYVECTHVIRQGATSDGKWAIFHAHTFDLSRSEYGSIHVLVPIDGADAFARKYGAGSMGANNGGMGFQTKPLGGIFHVKMGYYQFAFIEYGAGNSTSDEVGDSIFK